jgi:D-glycero-D-manno-heptose 1,7-bisphosphate phosphatase
MFNRPSLDIHAILLDRDGVINRERADYVKSWDEFEFLPGALAALQRLAQLKWPILVITNQSAIGRNLVTVDDVDEIHRQLSAAVADAGGRIDAFYICPHHPAAGCACRKPQPGLLIQAATAFHLKLARCIFIGDSYTDYQAANAAGCHCMLVNSGRQDLHAHLGGNSEIPVLRDLLAVTQVLAPAGSSEGKLKSRYASNIFS